TDPCPEFTDRELPGRTEGAMNGRHEPCKTPTEDRVSLRRGQKIAGSAGSRDRRPVVAAFRIVEGDLHEPRERHRAVLADLVADLLHQDWIRCVVRREAGD